MRPSPTVKVSETAILTFCFTRPERLITTIMVATAIVRLLRGVFSNSRSSRIRAMTGKAEMERAAPIKATKNGKETVTPDLL